MPPQRVIPHLKQCHAANPSSLLLSLTLSTLRWVSFLFQMMVNYCRQPKMHILTRTNQSKLVHKSTSSLSKKTLIQFQNTTLTITKTIQANQVTVFPSQIGEYLQLKIHKKISLLTAISKVRKQAPGCSNLIKAHKKNIYKSLIL